MARFGRKGRRVYILLLAIGTAIVVIVGILVVMSPGRTSPVIDHLGQPVDGSVAEKLHVPINGVPQGMFIRGRDVTNPVLLFVHGGTGMPEYFLFQRYPATLKILEELFTVCWWERRGAGISYSPEIPPESMTVEQIVADTIAVTDYLRDRFDQNRIYIMAHSGGTFFALQAVAESPADVGTTREMRSVITGVFLPSWLTPDYTIREKLALWRGKAFSDGLLWDEILATDLRAKVTSIDIPIYFLHGIHDYTVTFAETQAYFDTIEAPVKGFYSFEKSAHSPMFEEPERFGAIIEQDVLRGTVRLADSS